MFASDDPTGGLHHATAHTACAIVAGNRWDGFLSQTPTGTPIEVEAEGLLTDWAYYFIVLGPPSTSASPPSSNNTTPMPAPITSNTPYLYPIVPSFRQWRFPHGQLPRAWDRIQIGADTGVGRSNTDAVIARDVTCRMTDYVEECDTAHLCPKTEAEWFRENRMDEYTTELMRSGTAAINNKANVMLLRADLHRAYDKMRFVHVPKRDAQGELRFVTHLIDHSIELGQLYHNAELHTLRVAKEFLFARLAYDVFPLLSGFLQQRVKRFLLQTFSDDPVWASPDECCQYSEEWEPVNQRSSRTPSPTKRSRFDAGIDDTPTVTDVNGSVAKRARYDAPSKTHAPCSSTDRWPSSGETEETEFATVDPTASQTGFAQTTTTRPPKNNPSQLLMPDSSQSQSSTSDALPERIDQSCETGGNDSLAAMYDLYLRKERARSDPHSHWDKEQAWLQGVFDRGGALDASEMKRFAMAMGYDVVDDEIDAG
ncbi:MAG: hypothetical protein Q9171_001772 [Xanthocarpia ochracea]